jgi:chloramphenicol O-acetyltransferase type A
MDDSVSRATPRAIDPRTWDRREAFELFRGVGFPYLSVTANVDVRRLRRVHRRLDASFTVCLVYALATAANDVPAFRRRLRGEEPVEYETIHPSITVLGAGDLFRFVTLSYAPEFRRFAHDAQERIDRARRAETLWSEPDRDDLLYMTALPWVSFTALVHPVPLAPPDSVPRIAWGRYEARGRQLSLPLNVQAHHALVDGIDVGRFFEKVEGIIGRGGIGA